MAQNPLPDQWDQLKTLATDMIDGLHSIGVATGVKQNTEAVMVAALGAANTAENGFQTNKAGKLSKTTSQTTADSNGKGFIAQTKRALAGALGESWSSNWAPVGFVNNSLAIPSTIGEREALLKAMADYFTANPGKENAGMNVTAAEATARYTALKDTRKDALDATTTQAGAKQTRETAMAALRTRMSGLIGELATLLKDDDPRWYTFGLNRPGDPETPGIPTNLVVVGGGAGTLLPHWVASRRAARYRLYKKVVGTDADFVFVLTVTDTDATLSGLPSGATVQVQVTAANDAGESAPSAVVQILVP
jgi:hypothetical protein